VTTGSCCENCSRPAHTLEYRGCILGGSIDVAVSPQVFRQLFLVASTPDCYRTESHVPRELDAKMPEATNALHSDEISGAQTGIAQSVVGRDARAEQRSSFCGREFIRNRRDATSLRDHHFRIAAVHGDSGRHRVLTIYDVSATARFTLSVFSGNETNTNPLTDFPFRHSAAQGFNAADNFMPRNTRQS